MYFLCIGKSWTLYIIIQIKNVSNAFKKKNYNKKFMMVIVSTLSHIARVVNSNTLMERMP